MICTERISRYLKEKYNERSGKREFKLHNNRGVFIRLEGRIQKRKQQNDKGNRI